MSYTAPITALPQMLRQPIGIATLASLGIHGLLWAVVPSLHTPSQPDAEQQRRPVNLVELTPAEQNRLPQATTPQFTTPPVNLPAFAMQPSVLPPMPPPLASGLLNPPNLSLPPGEVPLYNYPLRSVLPPRSLALQLPIVTPPQNKQLVPQQQSRSRQFAFDPRYKFGQFLPQQPFKLPPNFNLSPPRGEQAANNGRVALSPFKLPPNPSLLGGMQAADDSSWMKSFNPGTQSIVNPAANPQHQQSARANPDVNPAPSSDSGQLPEKGKQMLRELIEQRRNQLTNSSASNLGNSASGATGQNFAQFSKNWEALNNQVHANYPKLLTPAPINRVLKTNKRDLEGSVALGVVVGPEGNIIEGPYLINGKANIEKAKEYVRTYPFNANKTSNVKYEFNLMFKYDGNDLAEATSISAPKPSHPPEFTSTMRNTGSVGQKIAPKPSHTNKSKSAPPKPGT